MTDDREMELCLCATCAGSFYDIPIYKIRRRDLNQITKEPCTYCSSRLGYDFIITRKRQDTRMDKNVRNRIIERISENQYTAHKFSIHSEDA